MYDDGKTPHVETARMPAVAQMHCISEADTVNIENVNERPTSVGSRSQYRKTRRLDTWSYLRCTTANCPPNTYDLADPDNANDDSFQAHTFQLDNTRTSAAAKRHFLVNTDGTVSTIRALNFFGDVDAQSTDNLEEYDLHIIVQDDGQGRLSSTTIVRVAVTDVNEPPSPEVPTSPLEVDEITKASSLLISAMKVLV